MDPTAPRTTCMPWGGGVSQAAQGGREGPGAFHAALAKSHVGCWSRAATGSPVEMGQLCFAPPK